MTGCNTILPGKGKTTCWKMVFKYPHVTGVENDDNVNAAEPFVGLLYGIEKMISMVS